MRKILFLLLLTVVNGSCLPFPVNQKGLCQIDDRIINTYKIYGVWKRTDPEVYNPNIPEKFDLIYFERGGVWYDIDPQFNIGGQDVLLNSRMCRVRWNANAPALALEVGRFDSNLVDRTDIALQIFEPGSSDEQSSEIAKYGFTGSCGETKLTLTRADSSVEHFTLYNYDPTVIIGQCQPQ